MSLARVRFDERPEARQVRVDVAERCCRPAQGRTDAQGERAAAREGRPDLRIRGTRADGRDQLGVGCIRPPQKHVGLELRRGGQVVRIHAVQAAELERAIERRTLAPAPGTHRLESVPLPAREVADQIDG
jgi:hypothetical protein